MPKREEELRILKGDKYRDNQWHKSLEAYLVRISPEANLRRDSLLGHFALACGGEKLV